MELKPCPFCGGDGSLSIVISEGKLFGCCWVCGARSSVVRIRERPTDADIAKAIEAWNRRVDNG